MSQESSLVKVVYRDITLMESAVVQDLNEHGGFLQTDRPLPVGTTLFIYPDTRPELEVGMTVMGVVEKRKAKRGENQPQPGMLLSFQGSATEFLASLEGFMEEENNFEMDAEPPEVPGDDDEEEAEPREQVSTGDFALDEGSAPRETASYGVIDDEEGDEEPPEIPDDDEDEPPEIPDEDEEDADEEDADEEDEDDDEEKN